MRKDLLPAERLLRQADEIQASTGASYGAAILEAGRGNPHALHSFMSLVDGREGEPGELALDAVTARRYISLSRSFPEATPEQVHSMVQQQAFLDRVDEIRASNAGMRYADALHEAQTRFPREFSQYERACGR